MLLRKRAQSTAEYAITIGLVIAVAAGVMQVALKGGMRKKSREASNFLSQSGTAAPAAGFDAQLFGAGTPTAVTTAFDEASNEQIQIYDQSVRATTVDSGDYVDKSILYKGGAERKVQQRTTATTSLDVETLGSVTP